MVAPWWPMVAYLVQILVTFWTFWEAFWLHFWHHFSIIFPTSFSEASRHEFGFILGRFRDQVAQKTMHFH